MAAAPWTHDGLPRLLSVAVILDSTLQKKGIKNLEHDSMDSLLQLDVYLRPPRQPALDGYEMRPTAVRERSQIWPPHKAGQQSFALQ